MRILLRKNQYDDKFVNDIIQSNSESDSCQGKISSLGSNFQNKIIDDSNKLFSENQAQGLNDY